MDHPKHIASGLVRSAPVTVPGEDDPLPPHRSHSPKPVEFLDGREGFTRAMFKTQYFAHVREKILELTGMRGGAATTSGLSR